MTFAPQELTFATGETQKVVNVTINGDDDAEPDELFVLNLSSPWAWWLAMTPASGRSPTTTSRSH